MDQFVLACNVVGGDVCGMKNTVRTFIQGTLRFLVRAIARLLFHIQPCHYRNLPVDGGGIVIANHTSYVDFIVLVAAIRRPIYFVMNGDLYKKKFLNTILQLAGCIPVSPALGKNSLDVFNKKVLELVDTGHLVVIFPEGTVSRTGQMLPFKKGIEVLSGISSGFIIPVHIDNMHGTPWSFRAGLQQMVKFRPGLMRKKIRVRFGKPLFGHRSRFAMWQEVKQLEALNLSDRVSDKTALRRIIHQRLSDNRIPVWQIGKKAYRAEDLRRDLSLLDDNLRMLRFENNIAVLLEAGYESMLIYTWLMLNGKTIVALDPAFDAEEQAFALRKAQSRILITTTDLHFMTCAPVAEHCIYTEDIFIQNKRHIIGQFSDKLCNSYVQFQKHWSWARRKIRPTIITYERNESATLIQHAFDEQQILLSLESLRQVYFFHRGAQILSNLPLWKPGGVGLHLLLPFASKVTLVQTSPHNLPTDIRDHACGLLLLTPEAAHELQHCEPLAHRADVFTTACHIPEEIHELLKSKGFNLYESSYSEVACGVFAINQPDYSGRDIVGKPIEQQGNCKGAIGKALPGFVVSIRDSSGNILPPGEGGELWIASIALSRRNDHAAEARRLREVNLHLRATMDEAGFIFPLSHSA